MKVAIVSDIHDNIWNLDKALKIIEKKGISTAIFCGDYCAPTTFKLATEKFKKAYCIWGNVDGEKFKITQTIYEAHVEHVKLLGDFGGTEIGGKKIAIIHNPPIARGLASSGLYDAVFYGHTHEARIEKIGNTLLANPGEVMGKNGKPSFGIWNSEKNDIKIIQIE